MTIQQAAERAGISHMTWINVEAGRAVRTSSYAAVERALNWPEGAVDAYLSGGTEPPRAFYSGSMSHATPTAPLVDVDLVLSLDRPDTVKVFVIKALRSGGDPLDAILDSDAPATEKVAAIEALREAQARAAAAADDNSSSESRSATA